MVTRVVGCRTCGSCWCNGSTWKSCLLAGSELHLLELICILYYAFYIILYNSIYMFINCFSVFFIGFLSYELDPSAFMAR